MATISNKTRLIIVIGIFVLLFVILTVIYILGKAESANTSNTSTEVNQNEYVDPYSGETVLNPDGKSREPFATNVIILGQSKLLDIGLSYQQLETFTGFLSNYATDKTVGKSEKITEISLDVKSFRQNINSDNGQITISSDIVINREFRQKILIKYNNTYDIVLDINSTDNKIIATYPNEG